MHAAAAPQTQDKSTPASSDSSFGSVKQEFGAAFGADFSGVSIAHDGQAEAMGAQAYAQGDSVHLAAGKGNPGTDDGRALLGHELAHVVQQRDGRVDAPQGKGAPVVADAGLEQEADVAGAAAARGDAVPESAKARGGNAAGAGQAKAEGAPIQMFGTPEHKISGDEGSRGLTTDYTWGAAKKDGKDVHAAINFTHGDFTTLSGDFFDPRDNDENGRPIADSLFRCAGTPSPEPGKKARTQDECLYALKTHNTGDPRFLAGGAWGDIVFGDEVVNAVEGRYLRLAAKNDEHFQHPTGAASGGPGSSNRASGGGSYRALHEDAILRAHKSKSDGGAVTGAMAHEAAAQHFLTDGFAAGHSRTPRGSIRSHWQGKYPLFFDNLKKAIAHETAIWLNGNITNAATVFGGVQDITAGIYEKVEEATKALPPFGFDDVVSLVVHDMDNERGLWVKNDLGDTWQTFGDGSFSKGETAKHCNQAVSLGCKDINNAYAIDASMTDDQVLGEVRARSPAPATAGADKYAPEQAVPTEDADRAADNGVQNWQADSFEALWKKPVRSDNSTETFEKVIRESMLSGELHSKLGDMSKKFPPTQEVRKGGVYLGTMTPERGYLEGFFQPIVDNPYEGMRRIIHYNPARGQSSNNTDDAVMEDFDRMDAKDAEKGQTGHAGMRGLTLEQRISRVTELLNGYTGDDEGERITQVFETTHSSAEAKAIYQAVEGHGWSGDFIEGWTVSDDRLWNGLTSGQHARVKAVLNR